MTTDYNPIAGLYQKSKRQPWRNAIEAYSLMSKLGDLRGLRVVDVACGEGHVTRQIRQAGAADVLGIDLSENMIALARAQEDADPLGIRYAVEDARLPGAEGNFDLAVAAWLLVYAHDRNELALMCRGLASRVRSGGRFVTFTTNPDLYDFPSLPDYRKYGFEIRLEPEVREGATIHFIMEMDGETLEIENYYLPREAYRIALEGAGFRDVAFHPPSLAPDARIADSTGYWRDFLNWPPAMLIDCHRI